MDDILSTNNKLKDIEKKCKKMEEEKEVERRQLQELGRKIGENKIITIYQSSEPTHKFDGNKEQTKNITDIEDLKEMIRSHFIYHALT